MKPAEYLIVFALDESTTWEDLLNDMEASAKYQNEHLGKILPVMGFAPMMEPEHLDRWEPIKSLPEHLLIVSLERTADKTLFRALKHAAPEIGGTRIPANCRAVSVDCDKTLADVYQQMEQAGIKAFAQPSSHKDDPSFFFVRGVGAVSAFSRGLRFATGSK